MKSKGVKITGDYRGEYKAEVLDNMKLTEIAQVSSSVDNFIEKVTYHVTDMTDDILDRDKDRLREWWDEKFNLPDSDTGSENNLDDYVSTIIDYLAGQGYTEKEIDTIMNDSQNMDIIYRSLEAGADPEELADDLATNYQLSLQYDELGESAFMSKTKAANIRISRDLKEGVFGRRSMPYVDDKTEDLFSKYKGSSLFPKTNIKKSLNEQEEFVDLIPFEDVEEGNQAIDYNGDEYEVVDKITYDGINIDPVIQFLREYDSTGAMQSELKEMIGELEDEDVEIQMLAVYTAEDEATYVFTYGDGAYVPRD